jgi:hypothetical protein
VLSYLKQKNEQITILDVLSPELLAFGRLVKGYDFSAWLNYMEEASEMPESANIYYPSIQEMEIADINETIRQRIFGDMDIQVGYCNGKNSFLNGLEYHKGNELFIAVTDLVVFLGQVQDIENNRYDTKKAKAFYVTKGTCLELYGTTLHSAPSKICDEGFKSIVVLPRNTNCLLVKGNKEQGLTMENQEDPEKDLLFRINKWLLVHEEHVRMISQGAYIGLKGQNFEVKY